jgi:DNA-binding transcriptional ArsR family regulator
VTRDLPGVASIEDTGSSERCKEVLDIALSLCNVSVMNEAALSDTFAALADPTRRAIVSRLAQGEMTVMVLAEPFAMSQPAVSRHLRVLEDAGLIARRVDGAKRPCRLLPSRVRDIDRWLEVLRKALNANYNRLDDVLAAMPKTDLKPKRRKPWGS